MGNFIKKFMVGRHSIIVENNCDLVETLKIICINESKWVDKRMYIRTLAIDTGSKWFINFNCSDYDWESIINELNNKGYNLEIKDASDKLYLVKQVKNEENNKNSSNIEILVPDFISQKNRA